MGENMGNGQNIITLEKQEISPHYLPPILEFVFFPVQQRALCCDNTRYKVLSQIRAYASGTAFMIEIFKKCDGFVCLCSVYFDHKRYFFWSPFLWPYPFTCSLARFTQYFSDTFKPPLKGKNTERLPASKQGHGSAADYALELHMPAANLLWEHALLVMFQQGFNPIHSWHSRLRLFPRL